MFAFTRNRTVVRVTVRRGATVKDWRGHIREAGPYSWSPFQGFFFTVVRLHGHVGEPVANGSAGNLLPNPLESALPPLATNENT